MSDPETGARRIGRPTTKTDIFSVPVKATDIDSHSVQSWFCRCKADVVVAKLILSLHSCFPFVQLQKFKRLLCRALRTDCTVKWQKPLHKLSTCGGGRQWKANGAKRIEASEDYSDQTDWSEEAGRASLDQSWPRFWWPLTSLLRRSQTRISTPQCLDYNVLCETKDALKDLSLLRHPPDNVLTVFYLFAGNLVRFDGNLGLKKPTSMMACIFRNILHVKRGYRHKTCS